MLRARGKSDSRGQPEPVASDDPETVPAPIDEGGEADSDPLPFEPAEGAPGEPIDPADGRRRLLDFYRHGRVQAPEEAPDCWPALLHPYRDLARTRHPYPLILLDADAGGGARPLSDIVDAVLADCALEGDDGERLKHRLFRLEAEIKRSPDNRSGARLVELWERAAATLIANSKLGGKKKALLSQDLALARESLAVDGELLACGPELPRRLLGAVLIADWSRRSTPLRERLEELIAGIDDVLRADFDHSPEAVSSGHLRESVGEPAAADVDFAKMSELLSTARLGARLSTTRRRRLKRTVATLRAMLPLFEGAAAASNGEAELPYPAAPLAEDCAAAAAALERRMNAMVDLFRAARTAELELENRYRESEHDRRFEALSAPDLSDEEAGNGPPLVLHLSADSVAGAGAKVLLELLTSGQAVKIVLALDDLIGADAARPPPWWTRLPLMATAFNDVFVWQGTAAQPELLQAGFIDALSYPGPALLAVYTGGAHAKLPPYLDAAAAADCRAFAPFCYDPGRGPTLADRMRLLGDGDVDQPWPRAAFRYRDADGGEAETEAAFTMADFLLSDRRLTAEFWPLPAGFEHPDLVPLKAWLELEPEPAATRVPWLSAVAAGGELKRVAVSAAIATAVSRGAAAWRALQEAAGIDNSFARALLEQERRRSEEELAQKLARIEGEYEQRLERDIGELTREIVERIAARLLAGGAAPGPITPTPRAAPPPDRPAEAPPADAAKAEQAGTAAAEEDDGVMALDEPYIDTPLCTSCDDCTNMSPRIFAYDDNKQAYIADAGAGTYKELVLAAEKCPVKIIHPGRPSDPDEPDLEQWVERAKPFL